MEKHLLASGSLFIIRRVTFLPVVERELRVASRRKSTYRVRIFAALIGMIVTTVFLSIESKVGGSSFNVGSVLFNTLAWMSFVFVAFAGMILTSDAVSQEKREGTLGLLFLTDLRGYDIILGKLMSNSVQSFYGLLAIFPVLALPLLMGGVTGFEFWRMMLVLVNGLFFSLALGIFVSSISNDSQKALHATFFLLALFLIAIPLLDLVYNWSDTSLFVLVSASPGAVFVQTFKKNFQMFWISLGISHCVGWIFLALASYLTPRFWQQKASVERSETRNYNWRFGSPERRRKFRAQFMEKNPVYWLIARQRWHGLLFQVTLCAILGVVIFWTLQNSSNNIGFGLSQGSLIFVVFGIKIWMSSQASRFFVEGWRTGSLELLLCSPLTVPQIMRGQWLALRRLFFAPVALILLMQVLTGIIQVRFYQNMNIGSNFDWLNHQIINTLSGMITFISGLIALGWVGMWMGLTTKKANIAVIKTFAFVQVIPWFAFSIVQIFVSIFFAFIGSIDFATTAIVMALLTLGKDIAFIVWARRRLYSELREVAASGERVAKHSAAPASPAAAPPVIASPA